MWCIEHRCPCETAGIPHSGGSTLGPGCSGHACTTTRPTSSTAYRCHLDGPIITSTSPNLVACTISQCRARKPTAATTLEAKVVNKPDKMDILHRSKPISLESCVARNGQSQRYHLGTGRSRLEQCKWRLECARDDFAAFGSSYHVDGSWLLLWEGE